MCLCEEAFQTALDRGLLAATVDIAARPCPDGYCVSAMQTEWLNQFALRFPLNRELRRDSARKIQIYRWFAAAKEEIPDAVERFWRPGGDIGTAYFCTVRRGTSQGYVCTIRVLDDGKQDHRFDGDDAFRKAIEWARSFVAQQIGVGAASERVRCASVEVEKQKERPEDHGERFEDRSVALAALVAFFSLAARLPVLPDRVFTGVPAESMRDVAPPSADTLLHKLQAVKGLGKHARLIAPPGSGLELPPLEANAWLLECNWRGALQEGLGKEEFRCVEDELIHSTHLLSPRHDVTSGLLRDVLLAILFTAGEDGLSLYEMDLCFDRLRVHYTDLNQFSTAIRGEMQRLQRAGVVTQDEGRWRCKAALEEPSPLLLERVHLALAEVLERQGEAIRSVRHRVFLKDFDRVRVQLEALLSSTTRLAAVSRSVLDAARALPSLAPALFESLDASGRIPGRLLEIVLRCSSLRGPFPRLVRGWENCEDAVDRLFWLQSVTETVLHLLWILGASSLPEERGAPLAALLSELDRRPSLGILCNVLARIDHGEKSPIQQDVLASQNRANTFVKKWNKLLHHHSAWEDLSRLTEEELDRRSNELARETLSLLERLRNAGGVDGVTERVRLPSAEVIVEPGGSWLFRRGVLAGRVRYWSFDEMRWEQRVDGDTGLTTEAFPAHNTRTMPGLRALNLPLDFLPEPVACAVLQLRQEIPALRQLANIDHVFRTLLELALPDPGAAQQAVERAGWSVLRHKRSYLEAIQCDISATAWTGAYLREEENRRLAFELVGLLERMEHAAAPRAAWQPWIGWASSLLGELIRQSPWSRREFSLFMDTPSGVHSLLGLRARRVQQAIPGDLPPGTPWIHRDGAHVACKRFLDCRTASHRGHGNPGAGE